MSFVDLYADDVWSEEDIINRTEAILRSRFSQQREDIISRKMLGFSLGLLVPTPEEGAELYEGDAAARYAQQEGFAARQDMALLQQALDYERHVLRLSQPEVSPFIDGWDGDGSPVQVENPDYLPDHDARAAAQYAIDSASEAVLELVAARHAHRHPAPEQAEPESIEPAPMPEPEPAPEDA